MNSNRQKHIAADRALIEQYRRTRSGSDFARIVEHFESLLMLWGLKSMIGQRQDVLDGVQDAFAWLYKNIDILDPTVPVSEQLIRIVRKSVRRNRIILSKYGKTVFFSNIGKNRNDHVPFEETILEVDRSPAQSNETIRTTVAKALDELPVKPREAALIVCYSRETSISKIARETGLYRHSLGDPFFAAIARLEKNPELRKLVGLSPVPALPKRQRGRDPGLTERQKAVVHLLHEKGLTKRAIARMLCVTRQCVMYSWRSALKKIAVSKELQAITGIGPGMYDF